jgi:hypothetical protein
MNEFSQAAANNKKKIRQKLSISAAFRNLFMWLLVAFRTLS